MKEIAEPFILDKARSHLNKARVLAYAGTGNPYFTTVLQLHCVRRKLKLMLF